MEKKPGVYIDANIFLHAILDKGVKGERARKCLQELREQEIPIYTATLTFDEVAYSIWRMHDFETLQETISAFFQQPDLIFISVDMGIIIKAYELMQRYRFYPRDAIHAAAALKQNIPVIISTDSDFDRIEELKRKEPK